MQHLKSRTSIVIHLIEEDGNDIKMIVCGFPPTEISLKMIIIMCLQC